MGKASKIDGKSSPLARRARKVTEKTITNLLIKLKEQSTSEDRDDLKKVRELLTG